MFFIIAVIATPAEEAEVAQESEIETELVESEKAEGPESEAEEIVNETEIEAEETQVISEAETETEIEIELELEEEISLPPEYALSLMENSFSGIANVTYNSENKAFFIEPTDQDIKTALILLLEGSTPEINASWQVLKDSFVTTSDSFKDNVGTGYQIHLLNPMNSENTLLIIMDGTVMYDAFSQ